MAQSLPPTHIEAQIGDVSGGSQVAVGSYIVQIGRVEGGVVNILNQEPTPPRARPQPVSLRPRAFPGLLDRETETTNTLQALASQQSVECSGEPGSGKTSLLRHLAHHSQASNFSAGVIYFQVHQQTNADLLQSFFDAFYESDSPIKPTETEIRHYLQSLNALVLLDDVETTPEQIASLLNIAPGCTFVAATTKRSLMGETREVSLKGLPTNEAVSLFERELGRALSPEEQTAVQSICESLGCLPQRILRAAHEARAENRPLVATVPQATILSDESLAAAELQPRSEDEKKVLAACAVFYGAPVTAEHVAAVAEVSGVESMLDDLEKRGLVQSHHNRYLLASDVNNALLANSDRMGSLNPWFTRALTHFEEWLEQHKGNHQLIAESAGPILLLVQWAVAAKFWLEVRHLGHGVEEALAVTGKWDMWATALEAVLKAAKREENRAEEAWALHQLGTRALCLGATSEAKASLTDALRLRETLNDQSGAAVTRHNLNILQLPPPPKREPKFEPTPKPTPPVPRPLPLLIKLGVPALVVLALLTAFVIWRLRQPPVVAAATISSFTVAPSTVPAGAPAQLCYAVENASSVRLEPGVAATKPTNDCLSISAEQTTVYTLTAVGADGKPVTQQATLNVETAAPPPARIVSFEVLREIGPGGPGDLQFRLCYEVRDANHAELDNNGGEVVLNAPRCQQVKPRQTTVYTLSATGADGRTVSRQVTVAATQSPSPTPEVVLEPIEIEFTVAPDRITIPGAANLCYRVKQASSARIDPDVGRIHLPPPGERECVKVTPTKPTTYTLTATASGNRLETRQIQVLVEEAPPKHARIIFFDATPAQIKPGAVVRLCYGVADAIRAGIAPVKNDIPLVEKECLSDSPQKSTRYVLRAMGADKQTETREVTVEVAPEQPPPPPEVPIKITFFVPATQTIEQGGRANICYSTVGEGDAQISPQVGSVPPSQLKRCVTVSPKETTVYNLTVTASNKQTDSRRVVVKVQKPGIR